MQKTKDSINLFGEKKKITKWNYTTQSLNLKKKVW